jgi:hypothetical protein
MTTGRFFAVFPIAFAAAYAVLYVIAIEYNLALFTYHPASEEFHWLVAPAGDQPAMYWYGWMATSGLGALAFASLAASLPAAWTARIWPGWSWAVPLAAMVVFGYILRGYFTR